MSSDGASRDSASARGHREASSQRPAPTEWNPLELAVRRLLDDYHGVRRRARASEARVRELESALHDISAGSLDPLTLAARLEATERENQRLRRQLEDARARVRRILARIDFLEDAR